RVLLAVVVHEDAVAAVEGALRHRVEQAERRHHRAGGQHLDLEVAAGHVVHLLGEVVGVLVEDVLRRPGALPAHADRALRLGDHREAERRSAGRGRCRPPEEPAARCRRNCLLLAHELSLLALKPWNCTVVMDRMGTLRRCKNESATILYPGSERRQGIPQCGITAPGACCAAMPIIARKQEGWEVMEASAAIETAKHVLLACGVILAAGCVAGLIARRLAVPDVVLYLVVGILLGPELAGAVVIKADSALNQIILVFGACYILFDGGASLRLAVLKQVWITIVVIATLGVVITGAITAAAAWWLLGVPLIVAALLGAAIASTDPATLVPVFRQVRIRERVAQTVMSESALNDATGAILTFAVLAVATGAQFSIGASLADLAKQAVIGLV